jgi:hypothetical protein
VVRGDGHRYQRRHQHQLIHLTPFGESLGAMAQLAAHLLCKQGVRGSSPLGSTHIPAGHRPEDPEQLPRSRWISARTANKYCSLVHPKASPSRFSASRVDAADTWE